MEPLPLGSKTMQANYRQRYFSLTNLFEVSTPIILKIRQLNSYLMKNKVNLRSVDVNLYSFLFTGNCTTLSIYVELKHSKSVQFVASTEPRAFLTYSDHPNKASEAATNTYTLSPLILIRSQQSKDNLQTILKSCHLC